MRGRRLGHPRGELRGWEERRLGRRGKKSERGRPFVSAEIDIYVYSRADVDLVGAPPAFRISSSSRRRAMVLGAARAIGANLRRSGSLFDVRYVGSETDERVDLATTPWSWVANSPLGRSHETALRPDEIDAALVKLGATLDAREKEEEDAGAEEEEAYSEESSDALAQFAFWEEDDDGVGDAVGGGAEDATATHTITVATSDDDEERRSSCSSSSSSSSSSSFPRVAKTLRRRPQPRPRAAEAAQQLDDDAAARDSPRVPTKNEVAENIAILMSTPRECRGRVIRRTARGADEYLVLFEDGTFGPVDLVAETWTFSADGLRSVVVGEKQAAQPREDALMALHLMLGSEKRWRARILCDASQRWIGARVFPIRHDMSAIVYDDGAIRQCANNLENLTWSFYARRARALPGLEERIWVRHRSTWRVGFVSAIQEDGDRLLAFDNGRDENVDLTVTDWRAVASAAPSAAAITLPADEIEASAKEKLLAALVRADGPASAPSSYEESSASDDGEEEVEEDVPSDASSATGAGAFRGVVCAHGDPRSLHHYFLDCWTCSSCTTDHFEEVRQIYSFVCSILVLLILFFCLLFAHSFVCSLLLRRCASRAYSAELTTLSARRATTKPSR